MYQSLQYLHSLFRWFVVISLFLAICIAARGYFRNARFSRGANAIRHWTATIAHIQLMIGITLYFQSPGVKQLLRHFDQVKGNSDLLFFGMIHSVLMLLAIVVVTIGSALAKRRQTDRKQFGTMLVWYSFALLIIVVAIPWPFSPFANRPFIR